jgi:hypothetical protein
MAKRRQPRPPTTMEEQAAELAKIDAELQALRAELNAFFDRRSALEERRTLIRTQLMRDRLKDAVGGYVKVTGQGFYMVPMRRLQPMVGDIGRLLKIGRTRALIDFGEDLHTWYIALEAIGTVKDPLTVSVDELFKGDVWRQETASIDEELDAMIAGPDEIPDEDENDEDQGEDADA